MSFPGVGPESWGQQTCHPFVHLLAEVWIGMHRQPDILPIAPDMVGQTEGHRWGTRRATLTQALVRHHKVVEADHEPDLPAVASVAPGQTSRATPQGRDQPTQCAIPSFHEGRLDRRAELTQTPLLTKTARAAVHRSPLDLHDMAHLVADLHGLGRAQVLGVALSIWSSMCKELGGRDVLSVLIRGALRRLLLGTARMLLISRQVHR